MAVEGYSRAQITLHWLTVGLVAGQFLFHDGIEDAFKAGLDAGIMTITPPAALHLGSGMLILGIVVYRLYLRSAHGAPNPPEAEPAWARVAAKAAHLAFYALLFLLPVTGAVAWAQSAEGAAEAHEAMTSVLFFLILAHIGAVLVHQFVWKTGLLRRMMRSSS